MSSENSIKSFNQANQDNGLGIDIVKIERMKKIISRTPCFVNKVYTENEIEYCHTRKNLPIHLATHFAAKEAVLKALGTGFSEGIKPRDIEILHNTKGKPYVVLSNKALEVFNKNNFDKIEISLSFTLNDAVSCAICTKQNLQNIDKKQTSNADLIVSEFKNIKQLIDSE